MNAAVTASVAGPEDGLNAKPTIKVDVDKQLIAVDKYSNNFSSTLFLSFFKLIVL